MSAASLKKPVPESTSPFAQVGAKYVDRGYSALPIMPGQKYPGKYEMSGWHKFYAWQDYCNRLPSEIEIELWNRYPADAGVCVALDKRLKVIDIDSDNEEMVRAICAVIPPSTVKKRGKKGFSAFYRGSDAIVSQPFNVGKERIVDLLAHGRQTVLPPTEHPDTGKPYVWLTPDTLEHVTIDELPELSDNIAQLITDALKPFGYEPPMVKSEHNAGGGESLWRDINNAALANLGDWVPALGLDGTHRSGKGYRSCATWRGGDNPTSVGFDAKGIKDFREEKGHSPIDVVMLALGLDFNGATEWLAEKLNFPWPVAANDNVADRLCEKKDAEKVAVVEVAAVVKPPRFSTIWLKDANHSVGKKEILKGVLGAGEFSLFVAKPGMGKSVLVGDIGMHIAAGMDWHGRKVKQGLVVYFAAERFALTERRVAAWRKKHDVLDVPFVIVGGKLDLTTGLIDAKELADHIKRLEDQCKQENILTILDTVTRTFGPGDQHQSRDMQRYVQSVDELNRRSGAHSAAIHHSPWSDDRGKGAIDLDGAIDVSFLNTAVGEGLNKLFTLKCTGANDGVEGPITSFRLDSVILGTDEDGAAITSPVVVQADKPFDGAELKGNTAKVLDSLEKAIERHGECPPDGSPGFPDGVVTVSRDQWRDQYYADTKAKTPAILDGTLRQRFNRASGELLDAEKIVAVGERVWIA
jgi:hypothetical protein